MVLERANNLNEGVRILHTQKSVPEAHHHLCRGGDLSGTRRFRREVIRAAGRRLYKAKEEGRDRVVVANSHLRGMALAN